SAMALQSSRATTPQWLVGTVMSIDVVGFTALTERFAREGRGGAERITRSLDSTFTTIIDALHEHGGDVLRFGGDALRVVFVGEGHHERATAAAQAVPRAARARAQRSH